MRRTSIRRKGKKEEEKGSPVRLFLKRAQKQGKKPVIQNHGTCIRKQRGTPRRKREGIRLAFPCLHVLGRKKKKESDASKCPEPSRKKRTWRGGRKVALPPVFITEERQLGKLTKEKTILPALSDHFPTEGK